MDAGSVRQMDGIKKTGNNVIKHHHKHVECKLCKQYLSKINYQTQTKFYCTTATANDVEEPRN